MADTGQTERRGTTAKSIGVAVFTVVVLVGFTAMGTLMVTFAVIDYDENLGAAAGGIIMGCFFYCLVGYAISIIWRSFKASRS